MPSRKRPRVITSAEALHEIMADIDSNDEDFSDLDIPDDFSEVSTNFYV